jgi:energy-coupling factor transporter transmembrane protein EcfT
VPGTSPSHVDPQQKPSARSIHPAALLLSCTFVGLGLSLARSPIDLAVAGILCGALAIRAEGRTVRSELPLWLLALVVFLAHWLLSGRPFPAGALPAALIALRLLALLYLLRWAARAFLGNAARWLLAFPIPHRPKALLLALESGRHAVALTPLAIREAGRQHEALLARGVSPPAGAAGRARYIAAWLLPYLGTMLRLGECYGEALAARGYIMGGRRSSGRRWSWGWSESAAVAGGAALAVWLLRGR